MEKEEYLYMVLETIENAKKLREDSIKRKEFYQKINGDKNTIRDLENNILLANKTISSLENLIYLPVYEIIQKMSNNDLLNCKKQILSKIDDKISKEFNIIESLKEECKELNKKIQSISTAYMEYKKDDSINESVLDTYVKKSKDRLDKIYEINNKIQEHQKILDNITSKRNNIEIKTIEEIKDYLINTYDLNNINYELERYKVTRSDEIIVNLCKDLKVLDNIESLIKEYITLRDKSVQKIIEVPKIFEEYKIKNVTNIRDFILTKCLNINYHERTNEMVIFDDKEIYIMKNNIETIIKEITNEKQELIRFKLKVNELSSLSLNNINKELIKFISILCNTLFLTEKEKNNINDLYNKYMKLVYRKHKTEKVYEKSIRIEKELKYEIKNILDVYWGVLCERLESTVIGIKSNFEFISNINSYNIHKGKDKMLFDVEEFSEIGLLNMRILIEKILTRYTEINNELNNFNDELSNCKNNMIDTKNTIDKKMNNIKKKIDELYYKISPNDLPILVEDYEKLNKIFNEKILIDSIVKINRKNLISQVRSESIQYRDNNNELKDDMEVIKKKVLNN